MNRKSHYKTVAPDIESSYLNQRKIYENMGEKESLQKETSQEDFVVVKKLGEPELRQGRRGDSKMAE